MAQLLERLLPTPEIRGSNPDIGKILSTNDTTEKTKIKQRPGMVHLLTFKQTQPIKHRNRRNMILE